MNPPFYLTAFAADHSVEEITTLLHEAYAPLAAQGLRYLASHQDVEMTRKRLLSGRAFVAVDGGRIIGTIAVYAPAEDSLCGWYRCPGHYHFGQFAVTPTRQRQGIGRALLAVALSEARSAGAIELALDTAESAHELIAWYQSLGFRTVEQVQWDVTNYRSIVMSKSLPSQENQPSG